MMSNKISIKSKLGAEFRRFSLKRSLRFNEFKTELEQLHGLFEIPFFIYYTDPIHGDLLPINNDDNFALAISLNVPSLKLHLQTKGESWIQNNGSGKKKNFFENINNLLPIHSGTLDKNKKLHISFPLEDFRQVSSIIDVDIVPETCRRVRLVKHGSDKPLGFYIRDGTSVRVTVKGLEKVPGIFISRLVPGGLAESTGLLSVNDEVLEVNGIEVLGKSLDQVTDMMVANSSNLIVTIRPSNQRNPFQYPKLLSQQQSILNTSHQNHRTTSNHSTNHSTNHAINHSSSNLSSNHDSKSGSNHNSNYAINHASNSNTTKQQLDQRIPQQNIENTLSSNKVTYYLENKSNEKVPTNQTNNYIVNLADGEDSDDDEDEIKHHFEHSDQTELNQSDTDKKEVNF